MVKSRFPKRVFAGIDSHTSVLQVCVLDRVGNVLVNRTCENDWNRVQQIVNRFEPRDVEVAIEACTGSSNLAEELVQKAGCHCSVSSADWESIVITRMNSNGI